MLRDIFSSKVLWVGVGMLVLGTGPLLLTVALDPKANPVGLGMLTFFTFWPSILLIVVGMILGVIRAVKAVPGPTPDPTDADRLP